MKFSLLILLFSWSSSSLAVTYTIQGQGRIELNEMGMISEGVLTPWRNEKIDAGDGLGILGGSQDRTTTEWISQTINEKEEKCLSVNTRTRVRILALWKTYDWTAVFCPSVLIFDKDQVFQGESLAYGEWIWPVGGHMLQETFADTLSVYSWK